MAIYNNREVTVMGPTHFQSVPETVRVRYTDGSEETVALGKVSFTKEEKDGMVKAYPSRFDGVTVASDDDIKAVRLGITPPSSPELKEQAESQARLQKQQEETKKNVDKAKADADKRLNAELKTTPTPAPVSEPANVKAD